MTIKIPARARPGPSIVLVSLVDVLFVLLLFFLLAAKAAALPALPVELGDSPPATSQTRILRVAARPPLTLDGERIELHELAAHLAASPTVILQTAEGVTLKELMPVLRQLSRAGVTPLLERGQ